MFVVYTPEGRSFIGTAQGLPSLKVDATKATSPPPKADVKNRHLEPDYSNPYFQQKSALEQYQSVQEEKERHAVVRIEEIMTTPVVTVEGGAMLNEAWSLMERHGIHHLPVYEDTDLVGICARSDLLSRMIVGADGGVEEIREEAIRLIMKRDVVTARPDTEIRQVAMALTEYKIGALPILSEDERLVGIVTLSDLVERLSQTPPLELYV